MEHGRMLKLDLAVIASIIACVFCVCCAAFLYAILQDVQESLTRSSAATPVPNRPQIQVAVVRLIQAGRATELYQFYSQEVGDPIRAELYVAMAVVKHEPVNLVISIGWYEGGHQVGRMDGPNENGSYDARPMGVNSLTFRQYSPAELQQVETNINLATNHFFEDRRERSTTWEGALAAYNHGSVQDLDERHVIYVAAILAHEWELNRRFAIRFADAL